MPVASTSCSRPQRHRLAVALDLDRPLLLRVVVARALALGAAPVVELHHLRVHLEPVADLVLGAEHRPVLGERQVRQVVVPHRVVQAQALVALAPGVAGPLVLLDDDRRHAQPSQPCAERDAALPAADDHDVGLVGDAELGLLLTTLLEPGLAAGVHAVLDALVARRALVLLEALQLGHRRQQRPGLAADQPHVTAAARRRRSRSGSSLRSRRRPRWPRPRVARLRASRRSPHVRSSGAPWRCPRRW